MRFMANRGEGRLQFVCLTSDAEQRFKNLPGQNDRGDNRTDKLDPGDYRRRLIYGGVDFVVGSLRQVGLRDRRDAHHGAHQEKNERPNSTLHWGTSADVTIAA